MVDPSSDLENFYLEKMQDLPHDEFNELIPHTIRMINDFSFTIWES